MRFKFSLQIGYRFAFSTQCITSITNKLKTITTTNTSNASCKPLKIDQIIAAAAAPAANERKWFRFDLREVAIICRAKNSRTFYRSLRITGK